MKTVLFVDDEEHILHAFQRAFRNEPFRVRIAAGVEQAREVLNSHEVSVIVSDYLMPGKTGIDLFARSLKEFPNIKRIMVSGHAGKDVVVNALNNCDIFRFFEKPCDEKELAHAIRFALGISDQDAGQQSKIRTLILDELEREEPGISEIERDSDGAIIVRE
jgi:DNA-binding NtrC family response regulator